MNPSTITLANLYVERQGGTGNWLTPINLNSYPGVTIAYNPLTNTATLDYSALPQTEMPTDDYAIVVKSGPTGVTDLVGNELDGEFSGTFPSGNGTPGTNFFEDLGLKTLVAPVLTTFQMTPRPTRESPAIRTRISRSRSSSARSITVSPGRSPTCQSMSSSTACILR